MSAWLRQNGYRITPQMEPLIKVYTDERMLFLAMKLQGGRESGDGSVSRRAPTRVSAAEVEFLFRLFWPQPPGEHTRCRE